jgi:hypothetical protein
VLTFNRKKSLFDQVKAYLKAHGSFPTEELRRALNETFSAHGSELRLAILRELMRSLRGDNECVVKEGRIDHIGGR